MKTTLKIFAAILLMAGISTGVFAQNTATTDAGAKIVSALTLTKTANLHFGTMSIPSGAVNVTLGTDGARTASTPANITLLAQAPVAAVAAYSVTGSLSSTYAITLPANGTVTINSGGNNMAISGFTAKTTSAGVNGLTGTLDALTGTDTFVVGATLELASGQAAGTYSGYFNVSVNYN